MVQFNYLFGSQQHSPITAYLRSIRQRLFHIHIATKVNIFARLHFINDIGDRNYVRIAGIMFHIQLEALHCLSFTAEQANRQCYSEKYSRCPMISDLFHVRIVKYSRQVCPFDWSKSLFIHETCG